MSNNFLKTPDRTISNLNDAPGAPKRRRERRILPDPNLSPVARFPDMESEVLGPPENDFDLPLNLLNWFVQLDQSDKISVVSKLENLLSERE